MKCESGDFQTVEKIRKELFENFDETSSHDDSVKFSGKFFKAGDLCQAMENVANRELRKCGFNGTSVPTALQFREL